FRSILAAPLLIALLSSLLSPTHASVAGWRALGAAGCVLRLLALSVASALRALGPQFLDGLAQIVAVDGVELPAACEAHARRRIRAEPAAPGAARQEGGRHQGGGGNQVDSE